MAKKTTQQMLDARKAELLAKEPSAVQRSCPNVKTCAYGEFVKGGAWPCWNCRRLVKADYFTQG